MKKTLMTAVSAWTAIIFAAACSAVDSTETHVQNDDENSGETESAPDQEAIFAQTLEAAKDIDHYEVDLRMSIYVESATGIRDDFQARLAGQVNETTENGYLELTEEEAGQKNHTALYMDGQERFENLNDEGWTEGDTADNDWQTAYRNVAAVLEGLEEAEVAEQGDYYEVAYSGNSIDVYNAFEYPYSLSLTGFDVEGDAHMEVTIMIDKNQYTINELSFVLEAEHEEASVKMEVNSDYASINSIDAVEIPEEVRLAAADNEDNGGTGTASDLHDALTQTVQTAEEVDHYELDLEIFITLDAAAGFTDESYARLAGQINESTVNGYLETTEEQSGYVNEIAVYMNGEEQYENLNGQGWTQSNPEFHSWETSYGNVAGILEGLAEAEVSEEEDHFEVTYSGNSVVVYEAFEYPFSLSLTGFDVENDTTMHVSVLIDKDQFTIKDMSFLLEAANDEGELDMKITVDYDNINNIDPVEIPDEVRAEAG